MFGASRELSQLRLEAKVAKKAHCGTQLEVIRADLTFAQNKGGDPKALPGLPQ